jgi:hypothetical protein
MAGNDLSSPGINWTSDAVGGSRGSNGCRKEQE